MSYIFFSNYQAVYDIEKTKHLKLVPALTEAHMHPNNFERQNVRRCAQFFSNHMADGMKVYSEEKATKHRFIGILFFLTSHILHTYIN